MSVIDSSERGERAPSDVPGECRDERVAVLEEGQGAVLSPAAERADRLA